MWLPERPRPVAAPERGGAVARAALLAGLGLAVALAGGCTVRPLYADPDSGVTLGAETGTAAALSTVSVLPVNTRPAQEVRNHLIFLLGGGQGQPAQPRYTVALNVSAVYGSAASIQIASDEEPTAANVTMVSNYVLTDVATGQPVATGTRQILSSYDVPRQEFAVLRARRDAENRAARELAELLRLVIAQELAQIEPARAVK